MFWRFEEIPNCNWGKDIYEYDRDWNKVDYRADSELSEFEFLHVLKDDLSIFAADFPGNILWKWASKIRGSQFCRNIRDRIAHLNWM